MTALAQGTAGLALVMGFGLLCIRQVSAASILLAVQSAAVAAAAVALHQPAMAVPPLLLAAGVWLAPAHIALPEAPTAPVGGAKLGVAAGAVLAVLCQSQGVLALPLAIILLSILLAATRRHPWMDVMALVGVQNGIVLGACLTGLAVGPSVEIACLILPLPLVAGVMAPVLTRWGGKAAHWFGWIDLGLSLVVFAATLLIPLDPIASVFAPLLGLDGVLRSCRRRNRSGMPLAHRGLALLTGALLVLAVCPANPIIAWLAVLASVTTAGLPTQARRWNNAVLASLGAGVALFGLLTLGPSILGHFAVFAGFVMIAAVVPDLAAVVVILLLLLAIHEAWPPAAESLGIVIAVVALLACAAMLHGRRAAGSVSLLQQSLASIAALCVCLGQADGRFAALVLLVLLVLTRSAARVTDGFVSRLAIAGLAGVPPLGVFPGLVLVVLAVTSHSAWLLLPLGVASVPMVRAGLPTPGVWPKATIVSVGWLPLALAVLAGYFAPDGLARWWHVLAAGRG